MHRLAGFLCVSVAAVFLTGRELQAQDRSDIRGIAVPIQVGGAAQTWRRRTPPSSDGCHGFWFQLTSPTVVRFNFSSSLPNGDAYLQLIHDRDTLHMGEIHQAAELSLTSGTYYFDAGLDLQNYYGQNLEATAALSLQAIGTPNRAGDCADHPATTTLTTSE